MAIVMVGLICMLQSAIFAIMYWGLWTKAEEMGTDNYDACWGAKI